MTDVMSQRTAMLMTITTRQTWKKYRQVTTGCQDETIVYREKEKKLRFNGTAQVTLTMSWAGVDAVPRNST